VAAAVLLVMIAGLWLREPPSPPRPSPPALAGVSAWSGNVQVLSGQTISTVTNGNGLRPFERLIVSTNGAASIDLTNGFRIQAGADTVLALAWREPVTIELVVERGVLAIKGPVTNAGQRLSAITPHLRLATTGAEFDLDVDARGSRVHVIQGTAMASRSNGVKTVSLAAGDAAQAQVDDDPKQPLVGQPFRRNVADWPFSTESPWNTSIGSRALLARITAPQWPPGALTNVTIVRQIYFSQPTDPRRRLFSPGEEPRQIRYPDWWNPKGVTDEIVCALFMNDGLCCEMTEPLRLGSLDIRVRERNSTDLFGSGVGWSWPRHRIIGGSAFAGIIRRGELTFGIPHALALAVNPKYLNATRGVNGHVWPGIPIAPEVLAQLGNEGNLAIGSLLALSSRTNVATLGVGTSGPGYEIARALQDYGAYIIQTTDAPLKLIASADAGLPPDIDAIWARLVPHLRLVSNNSMRNVGGGGERRRPPAPPFSE